MARGKSKSGQCWLCGRVGKLSFEHVPPKSAFNDRKVFYDYVANTLKNRRVKISQRGVGDYTLCKSCNNNTGRFYGASFAEFCQRGADVLYQADGYPTPCYEYKTYPLKVLKQIVTMFFSTNGPEWRKSCPELKKFVLNKWERHLPPKYRIFIYYNIEGSFLKHTGIQSKAEFDPDWIASPTISKISEIVHPPFGYVMTIDSDKPDDRLFEISKFGKYQYDERKHVYLKIPLLPIYTIYAGHYPSRKDIEEAERKYPDEPSFHACLENMMKEAVERVSR